MRKKLVLVSPPDPRKLARQLRAFGVGVLIAGVLVAAYVCWREVSRTEPTLEELLPGTDARNSRQMGLLYGPMVQATWDFLQELQQPYTEAALTAIASFIVMIGCFRLARRHDGPDAGHR